MIIMNLLSKLHDRCYSIHLKSKKSSYWFHVVDFWDWLQLDCLSGIYIYDPLQSIHSMNFDLHMSLKCHNSQTFKHSTLNSITLEYKLHDSIYRSQCDIMHHAMQCALYLYWIVKWPKIISDADINSGQ